MPTSMLKGTYFQSMDAKGRMSFPTKLREVVGERFIITRGIDGCLFVYSLEDFEAMAEKISALPMGKGKGIQRHFMAWASEVEADKQGRILIPQSLRELANLTKDVVVAGVSSRAEIWDRKAWEKADESYDDEKFVSELEELDF